MAGLIVLGVVKIVRDELYRHDVNTIDEFLEALRNTNMKTRRGTEPEQRRYITSREELLKDQHSQFRSLKWVAPLFAMIGLLVTGTGIYLGTERVGFLETALSVPGEVISLDAQNTDDGHVYYPVVQFTPREHTDPLTFRHDTGSNPPSYSQGEQVTVLYDPLDPSNAIIDAGLMNWFGVGLVLVLGFIFVLAGIASLSQWQKVKKAQKRSGLAIF